MVSPLQLAEEPRDQAPQHRGNRHQLHDGEVGPDYTRKELAGAQVKGYGADDGEEAEEGSRREEN